MNLLLTRECALAEYLARPVFTESPRIGRDDHTQSLNRAVYADWSLRQRTHVEDEASLPAEMA